MTPIRSLNLPNPGFRWICRNGVLFAATALALACLPQGTATAQTPTTFGYGTIGMKDIDGFVRHPATGVIPLLTILVDFTDETFPPDQPPQYYESLLFATEQGQPVGSIAGAGGFFEENSFGQFRYSNAGVIGPFHAIDDPDTLLREDFGRCGGWDYQTSADNTVVLCGGRNWTMRNAIQSAAASGFDFRQFDTNGDGHIQKHELMFLFVLARNGFGYSGADSYAYGHWGTNRGTYPEYCVPVTTSGAGGPLDVCAGQGWPNFQSDVDVATIAHEMSHAIGIFWEGYGHSSNENLWYSTMGATITNAYRDRQIYHLDPFAKIKLGWIEPKIVPVTRDTNACLLLTATEEITAPPSTRAIVLYDPVHGTDEFFVLEYRRALQSNYDGDPFHKGSIGLPESSGMAVWSVRTDRDTNPLAVPSLDGIAGGNGPGQDPQCGNKACQDSAIHIYPPPSGSPRVGFPQPGAGLWTPNDGKTSLIFPYSGIPSPISLGVRTTLVHGSQIAVEVNNGSCALLEGLDQSFFDLPPGILSHDRMFPNEAAAPEIRDVWTNPRFRFERRVRRWMHPGDPVQVTWLVTPISTDPTPMRIRIADNVPPGFISQPSSFPGDVLPLPIGTPLNLPMELIFDVQLNDGQTRTATYNMTSASEEGNFPVLSHVSFESPADGSALETPVDLESFLNVLDPGATRTGAAPALPAVTPPADITIPGTTPGGTRVAFSPALVSFLTGGSAAFAFDPSPIHLIPQIAGGDVNWFTLFPLGRTTVAFRFGDSSGNIASGTSTVNVVPGAPRISGTLIAKGKTSSGTFYVDIRLINSGSGNAQSIVISKAALRTLFGTGTVGYVSPLLPLTLNGLDAGASTSVRIYLNIPVKVSSFSITLSGSVTGVSGSSSAFSTALVVCPWLP